MISPEILIRYPFFGGLDDTHTKAIASIAQEDQLPNGVTIFYEGKPAKSLYFLVDGCVVLYYVGAGTILEKFQGGIPVGEINPGEPFGISAVIEPYILTSTARTAKPSRVVAIEAEPLRNLFKQDQRLAYLMMHKAAKAALERLNTARIQLAAAWA